MKEWMPVNPCPCDRQLVAQMESSFMLDGTCVCLISAAYNKEVSAQRKLLKYLITQRIHGQTFNEMLKQLEAK
jgi:hypothetical protein